MKQNKITLSKAHKLWLFSIIATLFFTGIIWLYFEFFKAVDIFSPSNPANEIKTIVMKFHGAAAIIFQIILGTLLLNHAYAAWKLKLNYKSGILLLSFCLLLIITGYGLYYFGGEVLRKYTSIIHWGLGLLVVPVLVGHLWRRKKK